METARKKNVDGTVAGQEPAVGRKRHVLHINKTGIMCWRKGARKAEEHHMHPVFANNFTIGWRTPSGFLHSTNKGLCGNTKDM